MGFAKGLVQGESVTRHRYRLRLNSAEEERMYKAVKHGDARLKDIAYRFGVEVSTVRRVVAKWRAKEDARHTVSDDSEV